MRDDILIQAIDNTEDVLLHGGKWSEEAKQRVREARRAGRRVSEMFSNLYNSTGRYINQAGRNVKRYANLVDNKYNISANNGKTRKMIKDAQRYPRKGELSDLSDSTRLNTIRKSTKAKDRQYNSVENKLKRAIPGYGWYAKRDQLKDADKFIKKNYAVANKRMKTRDNLNAKRNRVQERRRQAWR